MAPVDRYGPAGRVRFRRAVSLMVMTLVLPGIAQLTVGNRKVGRIAIRTWLGLWAVGLLVVATGLVTHSFAFWFFTNTWILGLIRFTLMAMAIGWAYLFVDAWRLGDPLTLRQGHRLAIVGINGVLCFSVAGTLLFASHVVGVQKDFLGTMFGASKVTSAHDGRYNVLLLGGDSGSDRWGLRPDSITVASIDADTGKTVLFGLPRNMLNFRFAKGSIMAEQFPNGYRCNAACMRNGSDLGNHELNSLATWAGNHKALFKGIKNPGLEATKEAVEGITGLKINYYTMVNLAGFQKLVDAVGGVTLDVRDTIPIGGIGGPITGHIKPGKRKLNGYQTLWFARSRVAADDYSRMARQKCVMNAMLHQLSPQTVVLKFERIAKASEAMIKTDIPGSEVDHFVSLALKARSQPVRTVSFVPPLIDTAHPKIAKIKRMVQRAIAPPKAKKGGHQAASRPGAAPTRTAANSGQVGGSLGNKQQGYLANQSSDLNDSC